MSHRLPIIFFSILLAVALALSFFILRPYLGALFVALVFYIALKPIYNFLLKIFGGRANLASLVVVVAVVLAIIAPLVFFGFALFDDAANLYFKLANGIERDSYIIKISTLVEKYAKVLTPDATLDVEGYIKNSLALVVDHLGLFFSSLVEVLISAVIMLFALFFLLRDGQKFKKEVFGLSPLADNYDQDIFDFVERAVNAVVHGSLVVGLVQGILVGIGFTVFGVPNAVLWGALAAIVSLIPTVGTAVIVIPAVIYLIIVSSPALAIGLAVWGIFVVGLADNFLKPILMNRGVRLQPLLVLLSVLGGLAFFGPIGFIAGPVIVSLGFSLLRLYPLVLKGN
ncbi:MAG TPA: AI-2E family transporter [Candidatus Paceibacterota bacterium]